MYFTFFTVETGYDSHLSLATCTAVFIVDFNSIFGRKKIKTFVKIKHD